MATPKTTIASTDPDFDDFEVRVHGTLIANVLNADAPKGEVWVHDGVDVTKALELKTGTVTIAPKHVEQPAPPASAGRTSRSRRSTSGA